MGLNLIAVIVATAFVLSAHHRAMAQVPSTHVDLHEFGWQVSGSSPGAQPLLYNALEFENDDSFWIVYPQEKGKELVPKGSTPAHAAALAHLSGQGKILERCQINLPEWFHVQLFVTRDGSPIVQSGPQFELFDSNCSVKATVSLGGSIRRARSFQLMGTSSM